MPWAGPVPLRGAANCIGSLVGGGLGRLALADAARAEPGRARAQSDEPG